ncbi:MAG: SDR family NAD(P)-dependent oxidoreductase [Paracoccaceae bacterium]
MELNLAGKHLLMTGASKGIGYANALSFAREGCQITPASRRMEALERAAAMLHSQTGATIHSHAADLSSDKDRAHLFDALPKITPPCE